MGWNVRNVRYACRSMAMIIIGLEMLGMNVMFNFEFKEIIISSPRKLNFIYKSKENYNIHTNTHDLGTSIAIFIF